MTKTLSKQAAIGAFSIIVLTYVVNAMDRIVYPALLPTIAAEYHFPLSSGGLLATLFTLGLGVAGIPGSFLFSRFKRRSIAFVGVFVYSLCTILTCLSANIFDMAAYRIVSGVGEALQNMAVFTIAGSYFKERRAVAMGSLVFAYGLGSFIGPSLGTTLLIQSGSWRIPLYVYGALGLVGALAAVLFVPSALTEQTSTAVSSSEESEAHLQLTLMNRNTCLLALSAAFSGLAGYGYLGLYPTYLVNELHFTTAQMGTVASMYGAGSLLAVLGGLLADRFNQKWQSVAALSIMAIVGYALFNVAKAPLAQGALSFVEGAAYTGFLYVNLYSLMQRSVRSVHTGRASGLMVTCLYLPAAISGYVFAKLESALGWGGAAGIQLTLQLLIPVSAILLVDLARTSCPQSKRTVAPATRSTAIATPKPS